MYTRQIHPHELQKHFFFSPYVISERLHAATCSRQQSDTFSLSDLITRLHPASNMSHLTLPAHPKTPLALERQRPN